nr:MAG TPA: hypothetical protein [Caudoviricetes sp.]
MVCFSECKYNSKYNTHQIKRQKNYIFSIFLPHLL